MFLSILLSVTPGMARHFHESGFMLGSGPAPGIPGNGVIDLCIRDQVLFAAGDDGIAYRMQGHLGTFFGFVQGLLGAAPFGYLELQRSIAGIELQRPLPQHFGFVLAPQDEVHEQPQKRAEHEEQRSSPAGE